MNKFLANDPRLWIKGDPCTDARIGTVLFYTENKNVYIRGSMDVKSPHLWNNHNHEYDDLLYMFDDMKKGLVYYHREERKFVYVGKPKIIFDPKQYEHLSEFGVF